MVGKKKFAEIPVVSVQDLPRLFSADRAGALEAAYRLMVKDEAGDQEPWTFTVYRGKCGLLPGDDLKADVVFVLDGPTLEELVAGLSDVATLYTQRRLGLRGNVDLAIRFPQLFAHSF